MTTTEKKKLFFDYKSQLQLKYEIKKNIYVFTIQVLFHIPIHHLHTSRFPKMCWIKTLRDTKNSSIT